MASAIRTVTVELLRKGPPHNQLLSPLTEYLGICGDRGAGAVTVPYEQSRFNAEIEKLQYEGDDEQDHGPRLQALREIGTNLAKVLGEVPGLIGKLDDLREEEGLINLCVVTSASELSMLPFELSKVPSATGRPSDDWLALQAATPVCITRRVRSVPATPMHWPKEEVPRILYVVGVGIDPKLQREHRAVLKEAFAPWNAATGRDGSEKMECVVELGPGRTAGPATIENIGRELKKGYAYVHFLAHGAESLESEAKEVGLSLPSAHGEDEHEVLTGGRFASLLRSLPCRDQWPALVLTASCNSGQQSDLVVPGGSFGQALHVAGIPLVVSSQFPLTTRGSTTLTKVLYADLPWGEHPLQSLARARARLHAEYGNSHDWASLVVYEALPEDLSNQLDEVRYQRARTALQSAQEEISRRPNDKARAQAERAIRRLPRSANYHREVEGLCASHSKQLAEREYWDGSFEAARTHLDEARRSYRSAAEDFLDPSSAFQRHATLHWVQIQTICLDRLMSEEPMFGAWEAAHMSASVQLDKGDQPFWAHGSLAELWLLRIFDQKLSKSELNEAASKAREHTRSIRQAFHKDAFPVFSTRRQFNRYINPWGQDVFYKNLKLTPPARIKEVSRLAKQLVAILDK